MVSRISNQFLRNKLTILALGLYFFSVLTPWLIEDYFVTAGWRGGFRGTGTYWSFMASHNNDWAYFQEFWFTSSPFSSLYGLMFVGFHFGWFLLFVLQVWVIVLCFSYRYRMRWLLRGWEATAIVVSVLFSSLVCIYQFIVQHDIWYESTSYYRTNFHLGFWIVLASLILLAVSYWRSPERRQIEIKGLLSSIKRSWRLNLVIILILVSAFMLLNEFQFQTHVTKEMVVEKRFKPEPYPTDSKLWENDFKTITTIAGFFRARVRYNSPGSLYCILEVPVISYRVLGTLYNSIGFIAREPIFLQLH